MKCLLKTNLSDFIIVKNHEKIRLLVHLSNFNIFLRGRVFSKFLIFMEYICQTLLFNYNR
jgi:hypothetical protein